MQNALLQDMFNLSSINSSRCNGHVSVSTAGKVPKRDRKGCKKGKIEAIMKNNLVSSKDRVRLQTTALVKKLKPTQSVSNNILKPKTPVKNELVDYDDPYTFTESDPPVFSHYPSGNSSPLPRKLVPFVSNRSNPLTLNKAAEKMVCTDRNSNMSKLNKSIADRIDSAIDGVPEIPSKSLANEGQNTVSNFEEKANIQVDLVHNKLGKRKKKIVKSQSTNKWYVEDYKHKQITLSKHQNSPIFSKVSIPAKRIHRHTTWQRERKSRHEALQRIQQYEQEAWDLNQDLYPLGLELSDSEDEIDKEYKEDSSGIFQRHWFMGCVWGSRGGRDSRLAQVSGELRRRVCQVWEGIQLAHQPPIKLVHSVIGGARTHPHSTALLLHPRLKFPSNQSRAKVSMLEPQKCSLDCERIALPCTRHCIQHIMYNVDQLLYQHCTAKLTDNTQCCAPVFDISHHYPLCQKHAVTFGNFMKSHVDGKPKKCVRKKPKLAALSRSSKRNKKKKKTVNNDLNILTSQEIEVKSEPIIINEDGDGSCGNNVNQIPVVIEESSLSQADTEEYLTTAIPHSQVEIQVQLEDAVEVVTDEVLAMASLDPTELANQASRLLEEHDITSMLNQIPADAFNDIFLEDKNGEYEPTREQTEGLERALEEVDKEVRSLERMTRALPLSLPLDPINLLDDVGGYVTFPNGFTSIAQPVQAQPDLRHS